MTPTDIAAVVAARAITEILHFTTNFGLIGVAAKAAVLSRELLDTDQYLEHICKPVWGSRWKDADWVGYVNMSISHISHRMFTVSRKRHDGADLWWPVLSFRPDILSDPGVVFATTNNSYEETVKRGEGVDGLEALFGPAIPWGHHGSVSTRRTSMPDSWTTNDQAEVLYPTQLGLDHLQAVYVETEDLVDEANGILSLWPATENVPVTCKPEVYL
ncbi:MULTISPECIES: DarT ssDNA thymidine ADP-ribosyltransferase family protein [Nocardioides]|uniref:DarT ssDNA thymidine ADP-ribosyltransferase family protein n=1 Tax=Nocardioides vastitatis TaxID=2568655 RepID=A0ABW0ZPG0_9ACTN|nr:DarT ssDNA thymidine ADP-ribosyltransferase family protein [Nocardioides sp.]THJ02717.1 DUF4433 domain-containing protein [Nocardioides sp.]